MGSIQQNAKRKLMIIGVDGLDPTLLARWQDHLPTLSQLSANGIRLPVRSVIPADSVPAWATIYTGIDPSHHGLLASIDYTKAIRGQIEHSGLDFSILQGRTFWDQLSRAGRRVCILNPFLAYPAWPVNGAMISGPPLVRGQKTSFPPDLVSKYDLPELGGIADFPSKVDMGTILSHGREMTADLFTLALQLMADIEWDLFLVCFLTLDRIEHFFWRFCDPEDPFYPGENQYGDAIRDFYVLIDRVVGELEGKLSSDAAMMVISDHGHRRRATKLLNVNELLRRERFLIPKNRIASKLIERTRAAVVRAAYGLHAEAQLFRFGRFVPKASEIRKSKLSVDRARSMGILSDFGGSTSFGGIALNRDAISSAGLTYEHVQGKLVSILTSLRDSSSTDRLVGEVYTKEQIYQGTYSEKFPDIIFVLDKDYGVHWSIYDSLIVPDYAHRLVSGGHDRAAVFLLSGSGMIPVKDSGDLIDIAPTVLHVLGASPDRSMQGQSLVV